MQERTEKRRKDLSHASRHFSKHSIPFAVAPLSFSYFFRSVMFRFKYYFFSLELLMKVSWEEFTFVQRVYFYGHVSMTINYYIFSSFHFSTRVYPSQHIQFFTRLSARRFRIQVCRMRSKQRRDQLFGRSPQNMENKIWVWVRLFSLHRKKTNSKLQCILDSWVLRGEILSHCWRRDENDKRRNGKESQRKSHNTCSLLLA